MSDAILTKLTLDDLRNVMQQIGYRVEALTDPLADIPYLRSATSGLAFDIRPGNRLIDDAQGFVDVALTAVIQIQGELSLDIVNRWNAARRFGRLQLSQNFLMLCLDVSVAGGVSPQYLRAQIEIWDRLIQELIAYLREELQKPGVVNGAASSVGSNEQHAVTHGEARTADQSVSATIQ